VSDVHCKIQTRPLVREGVLHEEASICQTKERKFWPWAPKGSPTPRRTGRLNIGRIFNSIPLHFIVTAVKTSDLKSWDCVQSTVQTNMNASACVYTESLAVTFGFGLLSGYVHSVPWPEHVCVPHPHTPSYMSSPLYPPLLLIMYRLLPCWLCNMNRIPKEISVPPILHTCSMY
jgi:hypothetical protein